MCQDMAVGLVFISNRSHILLFDTRFTRRLMSRFDPVKVIRGKTTRSSVFNGSLLCKCKLMPGYNKGMPVQSQVHSTNIDKSA